MKKGVGERGRETVKDEGTEKRIRVTSGDGRRWWGEGGGCEVKRWNC